MHSLIFEPSAKIRGWVSRPNAGWILGRDERNRFLKLLMMENPVDLVKISLFHMIYSFPGGGFNFFSHPYLGKIHNLTNIFQMGWNHQLIFLWRRYQSQLIHWLFSRIFEALILAAMSNSLQQFSRAVAQRWRNHWSNTALSPFCFFRKMAKQRWRTKIRCSNATTSLVMKFFLRDQWVSYRRFQATHIDPVLFRSVG